MVTLWSNLQVIVDLGDGLGMYAFVCNFTMYLYYKGGTLIIGQESSLQRNKMFHVMVLKDRFLFVI